MVHQCRTSEEPKNAEDHAEACACQASSACSDEGLPKAKPSHCKVCRMFHEPHLALLLP